MEAVGREGKECEWEGRTPRFQNRLTPLNIGLRVFRRKLYVVAIRGGHISTIVMSPKGRLHVVCLPLHIHFTGKTSVCLLSSAELGITGLT
jgi:hypothetical protein